MKWLIPAKTFLLGEYIAMTGGPAIVLTTTPCFEVELCASKKEPAFHPASPAGKFSVKNQIADRLTWHDPYRGLGGLGASSAEFLGAYWADCSLQKKSISTQTMLEQYMAVAWSGEGKRPSGYDVLAQASHHCVLIHQAKSMCASFVWPFHDLAFILVHTGQKLATHEHLKQVVFDETESLLLEEAALLAFHAFSVGSDAPLIQAVNAYHTALHKMNLVAEHTLRQIGDISSLVHPLAIKGCGALGADVILMLIPSVQLLATTHSLSQAGYFVLSTSDHLYSAQP